MGSPVPAQSCCKTQRIKKTVIAVLAFDDLVGSLTVFSPTSRAFFLLDPDTAREKVSGLIVDRELSPVNCQK
jgi:hypothetical protein